MPIEQPKARADIVHALRELAMKGAKVSGLVETVRTMAGYKDDAILPVLWYFTEAFCLPLPAVLPLREWFRTRNDEEIDAIILPQIEKARDSWTRAK